MCRCYRRRSQSRNFLHYRSEQLPWECDPRHLERDVALVNDDLRADLDQLLAKTRERPLRNRLWSRERTQEVPVPRAARRVGDDEADSWEEFSQMPLDLAYDPTRLRPTCRLIAKRGHGLADRLVGEDVAGHPKAQR
jgi:hypothetical protein